MKEQREREGRKGGFRDRKCLKLEMTKDSPDSWREPVQQQG
jgi:hypothetical protein